MLASLGGSDPHTLCHALWDQLRWLPIAVVPPSEKKKKPHVHMEASEQVWGFRLFQNFKTLFSTANCALVRCMYVVKSFIGPKSLL